MKFLLWPFWKIKPGEQSWSNAFTHSKQVHRQRRIHYCEATAEIAVTATLLRRHFKR